MPEPTDGKPPASARDDAPVQLPGVVTIHIEFGVTPAEANWPSDAAAAPAEGAVERLVTLDQAAALVNRSKRSLERYKPGMPSPRVRGRRGQPNEWAWSELRPWLEQTFGRPLPEVFPALARPRD